MPNKKYKELIVFLLYAVVFAAASPQLKMEGLHCRVSSVFIKFDDYPITYKRHNDVGLVGGDRMRVAALILGIITVWASSHSLAQEWQDILKKPESKTATVTTPIATVAIVDPNGQELPCRITEATTLRDSVAAVDYRAPCRIDVTAP
ncbi:MAG: hypothetical protein AAF098_17710, partial [Pseudomonadota bacterium]